MGSYQDRNKKGKNLLALIVGNTRSLSPYRVSWRDGGEATSGPIAWQKKQKMPHKLLENKIVFPDK